MCSASFGQCCSSTCFTTGKNSGMSCLVATAAADRSSGKSCLTATTVAAGTDTNCLAAIAAGLER